LVKELLDFWIKRSKLILSRTSPRLDRDDGGVKLLPFSSFRLSFQSFEQSTCIVLTFRDEKTLASCRDSLTPPERFCLLELAYCPKLLVIGFDLESYKLITYIKRIGTEDRGDTIRFGDCHPHTKIFHGREAKLS